MSNNPTTALDLVKDGANLFVGMKITGVMQDQLSERTELDTDATSVKVGTILAGQLVAHYLRPFTDGAVNATVTGIKTLWSKKPSRKTAE